MNVEELVGRLPGREAQPSMIAEQGAAISTKPQRIEGYVSPNFVLDEWPPDATALLVIAAGAVGKTSAAEALAERLCWPLIRAQRARVGSYSLSGLMQDALGFNSTYVRDVALGQAGVVVDSLDEAHFRVGTDNFLAFVENAYKVSGYVGSSVPRRPSVVLMSRSDTAELVRLAFLDAQVPLAIVHLDFFDRSGAFAFIKSYMAKRYRETRRAEYNVPLSAPLPFERLRDYRFEQVIQVLLSDPNARVATHWSQVREFLGLCAGPYCACGITRSF